LTETVVLAHVVVLHVPLYLTKYKVLVVGDTVMELPVPITVLPHEPENHSATAPVPALPPLKVRVVEPPLQIVVVPVILVGAVLKVFTVTVAFAHVVVLHVPLYLTKYVVLVVGDTVIELPVPITVLPHEPENQSATAPVPALPPLKVRVVDPPLHIVVVPVILVGATDKVFTVTVALAHVVVLHVPLYLTKYIVLVVGDTVIEFPVPTAVPPQLPENH
jgi:hypothetical protein